MKGHLLRMHDVIDIIRQSGRNQTPQRLSVLCGVRLMTPSQDDHLSGDDGKGMGRPFSRAVVNVAKLRTLIPEKPKICAAIRASIIVRIGPYRPATQAPYCEAT